MTFDSLRPRYDCRDYVTLTMTAAGLEIHSLPPTLTTGPLTMALAAEVPIPEDAIRRTSCWSDRCSDDEQADSGAVPSPDRGECRSGDDAEVLKDLVGEGAA